MKQLIILVGPPGSGKSTLAAEYLEKGYIRVNQDEQGKEHLNIFKHTVAYGLDVVVDRMNFSAQQRSIYLNEAKAQGYNTKIIVLHESKDTCFSRCSARTNHPTVKTSEDASRAINFFFSRYERPSKEEADEVEYRYPKTCKERIVWCDIDGTIANIDHRQHFVMGEKKNWKDFFAHMDKDSVNLPIADTLLAFQHALVPIVFCSGRPDNFRNVTERWLEEYMEPLKYLALYMRPRNDSRKDSIVKEIILDFEILTRHEVILAIDDRTQVVQMLRSRGITVLQCAEGNF